MLITPKLVSDRDAGNSRNWLNTWWYALRHTSPTCIGEEYKIRSGTAHKAVIYSIKVVEFLVTREKGPVKFKLRGGKASCQPAKTSGLLGDVCMLNSFVAGHVLCYNRWLAIDNLIKQQFCNKPNKSSLPGERELLNGCQSRRKYSGRQTTGSSNAGAKQKSSSDRSSEELWWYNKVE